MKSIDIDIPLQESCFRIIFEESSRGTIPEVPLRQTVLSRITLDLFYWGCAKKKNCLNLYSLEKEYPFAKNSPI